MAKRGLEPAPRGGVQIGVPKAPLNASYSLLKALQGVEHLTNVVPISTPGLREARSANLRRHPFEVGRLGVVLDDV